MTETPETGQTRWSANRAAIEFGVSLSTLFKRLRQAGYRTGKGITFTAEQVHKALSGDMGRARVREIEARTTWLERRNLVQHGDLVSVSTLATLYTSLLSVIQVGFRRLAPALVTQFHIRLSQEEITAFSKRFREELSNHMASLFEHIAGEYFTAADVEKDILLMMKAVRRQEEEIAAENRARRAMWEAEKQSGNGEMKHEPGTEKAPGGVDTVDGQAGGRRE
jgi:hypothetical protein